MPLAQRHADVEPNNGTLLPGPSLTTKSDRPAIASLLVCSGSATSTLFIFHSGQFGFEASFTVIAGAIPLVYAAPN